MSSEKAQNYQSLLIVQLKHNISREVGNLLQNKLGIILTIIDGCIPDKEQRKAIKDLIRRDYWSNNFKSEECYWLPEILAEFDKKSGLNEINTDGDYRRFMNAPEKLINQKEQMENPRAASFFNN
jgi:hypothetical protein